MAPSLRERRAAALATNAQAALANMAERVATRLSAGFLAVNGLTDAHLRAWLDFAIPLAEAGKQAAVQLAYAHGQVYAAFAGRDFAAASLPPVEAVSGAALRGGTPVAEVYGRSMIKARSMIANGHDFESAMDSGAARAAATGRSDVGHASRAAQSATLAVTEGARGFVRVPAAGACRLCQLIATQAWARERIAPAHANCRCAQAPVIDGLDIGRASIPAALGRLGLGARDAADELARIEWVDTEAGPSPREVA